MLRQKITTMKGMKDALPFTEMSANVLDKYKNQYMNVYNKGALIGMCLDIKLRQLSGGKYGTQNLMQDLSKTYGKEQSFKDDELFDKITSLTFPEIRQFFAEICQNSLNFLNTFVLSNIFLCPRSLARVSLQIFLPLKVLNAVVARIKILSDMKLDEKRKPQDGRFSARIDGGKIDFSAFKGKKILVVNTASECGYTPQYKELQALYIAHQEHLVVVGVPANDFGGQEPGTNAEIGSFCQKNYGVTFPMAAKSVVTGENACSLYQWLTKKANNGVLDATITWNFNKFLLNEEGKLIKKMDSKVKPNDPEILDLL
jgi:glutathione peroxidase